jgi:hypothetical protein
MLRTLWRYGFAVLTVAAALVITKSLEQYTDITPLFYAAIVISAWFGGMGPGSLPLGWRQSRSTITLFRRSTRCARI